MSSKDFLPPCMAVVVKVSRKGQVTLPAKIRQNLKIRDDTYLLAEEVGEFVVLRRLETRFEELAELFRREAGRRSITRDSLLRALKDSRRRRAV